MTWTVAVGPGHPVVQVLAAPEVVSASVALVVALLGWVTWRVKRSQVQTDAAVARVGVHAARAAAAAEQAAEQTTNAHKINLRDDLDEKIATVLARLDAAEMARQAADAERRAEAAETVRRMARTEAQLDGLRDDVRAIDTRMTHLDGRLTHLDESADVEHERLREQIRATRT